MWFVLLGIPGMLFAAVAAWLFHVHAAQGRQIRRGIPFGGAVPAWLFFAFLASLELAAYGAGRLLAH